MNASFAAGGNFYTGFQGADKYDSNGATVPGGSGSSRGYYASRDNTGGYQGGGGGAVEVPGAAEDHNSRIATLVRAVEEARQHSKEIESSMKQLTEELGRRESEVEHLRKIARQNMGNVRGMIQKEYSSRVGEERRHGEELRRLHAQVAALENEKRSLVNENVTLKRKVHGMQQAEDATALRRGQGGKSANAFDVLATRGHLDRGPGTSSWSAATTTPGMRASLPQTNDHTDANDEPAVAHTTNDDEIATFVEFLAGMSPGQARLLETEGVISFVKTLCTRMSVADDWQQDGSRLEEVLSEMILEHRSGITFDDPGPVPPDGANKKVSTTDAAPAADDKPSVKQQLYTLFSTFDPERLFTLDEELERNKGREAEYLVSVKKYFVKQQTTMAFPSVRQKKTGVPDTDGEQGEDTEAGTSEQRDEAVGGGGGQAEEPVLTKTPHQYRVQTEELYKKYAPSKLAQVADIMLKHQGEEAALYEAVKNNYETAFERTLSTDERAVQRSRVVAMFIKHAPEKLRNVDTLLSQYGHERVLLSLLEKYGPEPTAEEREKLLEKAGITEKEETLFGFYAHRCQYIISRIVPPPEREEEFLRTTALLKANQGKEEAVVKRLLKAYGRAEEPYEDFSDPSNPVAYFGIKEFPEPVVFELFANVVPHTVRNFLAFCSTTVQSPISTRKLSLSNSLIRSIVPNVGVIFGSPRLECIYGTTFQDESFAVMPHEPGTLLMHNNNRRDNNSGLFMVTTRRCPQLVGKAVGFGRVVSGLNTFEQIMQLPAADGFNLDCPLLITESGRYK